MRVTIDKRTLWTARLVAAAAFSGMISTACSDGPTSLGALASIVVTSTGSPLPKNKTVTWKGMCTVHDSSAPENAELKAWFYTELSAALRPDSIVGWYKYTSVSGDNGFIEFQLLGSATTPDTIGYVRFLTPTSSVANYTHFSVPIVYRSPNPVAKSIWIISSSAGFTAQVNLESGLQKYIEWLKENA